MRLIAKLIIKGKIKTETGLHIGGSKSSLDIGEVDLNVIKTPGGVPFIPGSSLKGKLRSLLARTEGSLDVGNDPLYIKEIFGSAADSNNGIVTRLLVRDANLDVAQFKNDFSDVKMDFEFSDVKWENRIDRKSGTAKDPRQLERVPSGTCFNYELIYDVYDDGNNPIEQSDPKTRLAKHLWAIHRAMQLLEDDYIGGQGSRGYGKVRFEQPAVEYKKIDKNAAYAISEEKPKEISAFESDLGIAITSTASA
ncbi:MAG: type III-A CRISPR-associated RAMP protein Csm3 [Saprospiraceae bacterium]|nr:type III-A CRISPR-associated RAMP protein Csm3 [Saprospiraceae bacterium]